MPTSAPSPEPTLRELAERATPGPWRNDWRAVVVSRGDCESVAYVTSLAPDADDTLGGGVIGEVWYDGYNTAIRENDAAYIAAASPDAILALLDERDALRVRAEAAERELERAIKRAAAGQVREIMPDVTYDIPLGAMMYALPAIPGITCPDAIELRRRASSEEPTP